MSKFDWGSRCAECGKPMPSGTLSRCENGGHCSWHIPSAVREVIAEMYELLRRIEAEQYVDRTKLIAVLDKADGAQ